MRNGQPTDQHPRGTARLPTAPKAATGQATAALSSKAAESVGSITRALTANALKYPALRFSGPSVDISRAPNLDYGARLFLTPTWTQQGVPAVPPKPLSKGLGRDRIDEAPSYRLGAEADLQFREGGARCAFCRAAARRGRTGNRNRGSRTMTSGLAGKRILVVEDEYFIASDLNHALQRKGAVVIGPVGDVQKGLALVSGEAIDAALLDVNLDGIQSYPIADQLAKRGVPYVFLTGYDGWALPEAFRSVPCVAKPFVMTTVLSVIEQVTSKAQAA